MKKALFLVLALFVAIPLIAQAATIGYSKVTTYADNVATPIPAAKLPLIVYKAYWGPTNAGPNPTLWPNKGVGIADVSSLTAPDPVPAAMPPPGQSVNVTWYYTVTATLEGYESAAAPPGMKTVTVTSPLVAPGAPSGITVQ